MNIDKLWDRIMARIEMDSATHGRGLHKSSFDEEVKAWLVLEKFKEEKAGARLAADGIAVDVICGGFPCQDISAAGSVYRVPIVDAASGSASVTSAVAGRGVDYPANSANSAPHKDKK